VEELLVLIQLPELGARIRINSRADRSSASRSRVHSRSSPACCCSTNPSVRSMRRSAWSCAVGCGACTSRRADDVFVTHDQEEALELADRVVVMREGRIEQGRDRRRNPPRAASPFVFEFIGRANRLEGEVTRGRFQIAGHPLGVADGRRLRRARRS
jgi:sulfate transport system ATP-binding protein